MRSLHALAVATLLALLAPPALAASNPGTGAAPAPATDTGSTEVHGSPTKPGVTLIFDRAEFRFEGAQLQRSFVADLLASARRNLF